jgi:hypothetical protein
MVPFSLHQILKRSKQIYEILFEGTVGSIEENFVKSDKFLFPSGLSI